jgi:acyl-CoA thioesterase FadM
MRAGDGHFVQVFVDRMRGKPAAIPSKVPSCLQRLQYLRDPAPSDRLKRCG